MLKNHNGELLSRIGTRAMFLRECFKSLSCSHDEPLMDLGTGFFQGMALVMGDLIEALDELENEMEE